MDTYALGLIYSIGRYDETRSRYIVRCRDRFTVDYLQNIFGGTVHPSHSLTGDQYTLRIVNFDISALSAYGWTPRNADTRDIPVIDDYAPFLRAYFEHHCRPHLATAYVWGNKADKYYRPDIRVYGNIILLTSLVNILHNFCHSNIPAITSAGSDKSKIVTYGCADAMRSIYDYLYGTPCNIGYWDNLYEHITSGNPAERLT